MFARTTMLASMVIASGVSADIFVFDPPNDEG